jgi:para-aminobenzoate synthetase component I
VLWSGGEPLQARWSLLGRVSSQFIPRASSADSLRRLLAVHPHLPHAIPTAAAGDADTPPFSAGWFYALSYELGAIFEPAAQHRTLRDSPTWPLLVSQRVDDGYIFDHLRKVWWAFGAPPALREQALPLTCEVGTLTSEMGQAGYMERVQRVLAYIRAGDVYQVNLAHCMRAAFAGSPRALFARLMHAAQPWFGACMEFDDDQTPCAIASASPELFIKYDPVSRRVTTRPMKGTRVADADKSLAPDLRDSVKDQAELTMIVDLMRNDLGRVAELGSVRVETPRTIETHGSQRAGVLQATATVSARVLDGLTWLDLLRAIFPGGSVTGAPKIRAMQIINELEPTPRGPYCGAVGYISDSGHATFNIAIRTALLREGTLSYSVGAGLVADSDPLAEWQETLVKASVLRAAVL